MEFENKVAVITGGAHGIGKATADAFRNEGAQVAVTDLVEGDHFVGDISKKEVLEQFAEQVIRKYRKIDFLIQEMNREANTTLSKANDVDIANYGIELKTEIEKIREQIQNIE